MDTVKIKVGDLKPYERNAKKHDDRQIKNVMESIEKFGFVQPIVVDKDNVVIIGHCRLIAAKRLKLKEVPCVMADNLSEDDVKRLRLLDNKLNESEWDYELLSQDIPELDFSDFDVDWGLDDIAEPETAADIIEDEPPELSEAAKSLLGDVFELGGVHRLICGDSTDSATIERLLDGAKADMVFTDPPYQLDTQGGGILKNANSMKQIKQNGVDTFNPSLLKMWSKTNVFCHNKPLIKGYIELAERSKMAYDLAFYKKKNTVPNYKGHLMTDVEYIAIIGSQNPNPGLEKEMYSKCFIGQKDNDNELSYSKPVALCAKYIQLFSHKSVLDMFGGSGSTLIACEQLGRKCYMCELDPRYVDVIVQRYINFKGSDEDVYVIRDGQRIPYREIS